MNSHSRRLGYAMIVHDHEREGYLDACWERLKRMLGPVLLQEIWPNTPYTITKGSSQEEVEDGLKISYWVDVEAIEDGPE